jgi:hypothetical protein
LKRFEFHPPHPFQVVRNYWHDAVGVLTCVPVPWKVFGGGETTFALTTANPSDREPRNFIWVTAETSDVDDWVFRVNVDINDRGKNPLLRLPCWKAVLSRLA